MILWNLHEHDEDRGIWIRKDRYPRQNKRFQPFINGCNMRGARWPRDYWKNIIRRSKRNRIQWLWIRTHNPDWSKSSPEAEKLERDLKAISSPFDIESRR